MTRAVLYPIFWIFRRNASFHASTVGVASSAKWVPPSTSYYINVLTSDLAASYRTDLNARGVDQIEDWLARYTSECTGFPIAEVKREKRKG